MNRGLDPIGFSANARPAGPTTRRVTVRRLIVEVAALLLFVMNSSAADKIVFDFTQPTATNAWQVVNDDVMGGVSTSAFRVGAATAVFSGNVSLDNNGGFASVRSRPARHDLAGSEALVLRVRGDGRRYKLTARMSADFDSPVYQAVFTTVAGDWQEHRLPLGKFTPTFRGRVLTTEPPLDPARIVSVGLLIADQQAGPFQLEVAWIKAAPPAGK